MKANRCEGCTAVLWRKTLSRTKLVTTTQNVSSQGHGTKPTRIAHSEIPWRSLHSAFIWIHSRYRGWTRCWVRWIHLISPCPTS